MHLVKIFKNFILSLILIQGIYAQKESFVATLTVAVSPDAQPFEFRHTDFRDKQTDPIGFDIDLIQEIAKRLHMKVKFHEADFGSLLGLLKSKRADVVIASMSSTPERLKSVDFSEPYVKLPFAFLSQKKEDVRSFENLKGKKIATQLGTVHEQFLKEKAPKDIQFETMTFNRTGEIVQDIKVGRIHATVLDSFVAREFVKKNNDLVMHELSEGTEFAIAMDKGSPLKAKIDTAIKTLKSEGFIDKIYQKWLVNYNAK
jgi:ABC-type amino acid transport substrate-binding protein